MSLYVIDNGGQYSDHKLFFVESDQPDDVVRIVATAIFGLGITFVCKVVNMSSVLWRDGNKAMSLDEFIDEHDYRFYDPDDIDEALDLPGYRAEHLMIVKQMLMRRCSNGSLPV
jgi:hypothetical protein